MGRNAELAMKIIVLCAIIIGVFIYVFHEMGRYPNNAPIFKISNHDKPQYQTLTYLHTEEHWFNTNFPVLDSPYSTFRTLTAGNPFWIEIVNYWSKQENLVRSLEGKSRRDRYAIQDQLQQNRDSFYPLEAAKERQDSALIEDMYFSYSTARSIWGEDTQVRTDFDSSWLQQGRFFARIPIYWEKCGYEPDLEKDTPQYRLLCDFNDHDLQKHRIEIIYDGDTKFEQATQIYFGRDWSDNTLVQGDILQITGYFGCKHGIAESLDPCEVYATRIGVAPR